MCFSVRFLPACCAWEAAFVPVNCFRQMACLGVSAFLKNPDDEYMRGETEERWRQLCEQAVRERDPDKLLKLTQEINRVLEEKEKRLLTENDAAQQKGAA